MLPTLNSKTLNFITGKPSLNIDFLFFFFLSIAISNSRTPKRTGGESAASSVGQQHVIQIRLGNAFYL
jgi:hypothetical protein